MKRLILFIMALFGLVACNTNPKVVTVQVDNTSSTPAVSYTHSESFIEPETSTSEPEDLIKEYTTDALRIMEDTTKAIWKEDIPENPYTEPDVDGVMYSNYTVEGVDPDLGVSLLEFQRIENFPNYLFILQPPTECTVDNEEAMVMFMVTSNCLHVLCVYDYYEGSTVTIKFEAGPYKAFI